MKTFGECEVGDVLFLMGTLNTASAYQIADIVKEDDYFVTIELTDGRSFKIENTEITAVIDGGIFVFADKDSLINMYEQIKNDCVSTFLRAQQELDNAKNL